jgi:hypothetical protein
MDSVVVWLDRQGFEEFFEMLLQFAFVNQFATTASTPCRSG